MINLLRQNYLSHRETLLNFLWRALQGFSNKGTTVIIFILCAKLLSPYDFGIYNYLLAIIFLLIIFGDFGISSATSKYVAEYNATDKEKMKLILFNSLVIIIAMASVVIILTIFFGKYLLHDKYIYISYILPLLILAPISSLYEGIFRGMKKFKELALLSSSAGIISSIFAYFLISNYGLIGAIMSQNLLYLLLIIALFITHGKFNTQFDKQLMKTLLNYSLIIGASSIGYFLYSRVDIIILGHYDYIEEIGYYELINKGLEFMYLPFALLGQVVSPNITAYYSKNKYSIVREKLYFYIKVIIPASIIIAVLFYLLFPQLIKYFISEYYVEEMLVAVSILTFLIPFKIWAVFQNQSFIVATGFAQIIAVTAIIGGFLNIIFDIISINIIGFAGVFWVTLIIHSTSIVFQTIYYKSKIEQLK